MNKYTWNAAPRGKNLLKVVTLGETHDEAQERAKEIVRDVWKDVFEKNPDHEIVGLVAEVEQVDVPINFEPVFING